MDAPASTREKRIKFIQSFGPRALRTAIEEAVCRLGEENFLSDEQLEEITAEQIRMARENNRNRAKNLQLLKARQTELRKAANELRESGMRCNCDLDSWEPERSTGHSWVCRIHKAAIAKAGDA